ICRYQDHHIAKPGRPRNRSELLYELREGLRTPVISGYGTNEIRTLFCIMLAKPEPAGPRRAPALRGGPLGGGVRRTERKTSQGYSFGLRIYCAGDSRA